MPDWLPLLDDPIDTPSGSNPPRLQPVDEMLAAIDENDPMPGTLKPPRAVIENPFSDDDVKVGAPMLPATEPAGMSYVTFSAGLDSEMPGAMSTLPIDAANENPPPSPSPIMASAFRLMGLMSGGSSTALVNSSRNMEPPGQGAEPPVPVPVHWSVRSIVVLLSVSTLDTFHVGTVPMMFQAHAPLA